MAADDDLIECLMCFDVYRDIETIQCKECRLRVCRGCTIQYVLDHKKPICPKCNCPHPEIDIRKNLRPAQANKIYPSFIKSSFLAHLKSDRFRRVGEVQADEQIKKLYIECRRNRRNNDHLKQEIDELKAYSYGMTFDEYQRRFDKGGEMKDCTTVGKFVCPCDWDGCDGLVGKDGLCPICSRHTCSECYQSFADTHECDPNTLLTIREIKQDSKPCPKCKIYIDKTFGCDQMFCVHCRTYWDWSTGKEDETGGFHNPDAHRLAQTLGVDVGTFVNVGGMNNCLFEPPERAGYAPLWFTAIYFLWCRIAEMDQLIIKHTADQFHDCETLLKWRLSHTRGAMSDKEYQDKMYRHHRSVNRINVVGNILATFRDIFRALYIDFIKKFKVLIRKKEPSDVKKRVVHNYLNQMDNLRKIMNDVLVDEVSTLGGSVVLYIPKGFTTWSTRKKDCCDDTFWWKRGCEGVWKLIQRCDLEMKNLDFKDALKSGVAQEKYPYGPLPTLEKVYRYVYYRG